MTHAVQRPDRPTAPGTVQGSLLLGLSCLSVLCAVLIAPLQPAMVRAFSATPGVEALVPISLTVPALVIALTAPFAGRIADAVGRVRLLTLSLVAYAVLGTAPLYLPSLGAVVASRAVLGVAEAGVMVCATTLLGDYFRGARRDRWFGLQTVTSSLAAVGVIALSGALGAGGWRTPFWLYAVGLVGAVLAPRLLTEPARRGVLALPPMDWRAVRLPVAVTAVGGIVFFTPVIELSFALDEVGVTSTTTIGAVSAVAAVGASVGALSFRWLAGRGHRLLAPAALVVAAAGLAVMGVGSALAPILVGAVLASLGTGLLMPTLLTWTMGDLPAEQRGRAAGLFTGAFFVGEFVCPLLVFALTALLGSLSASLVAVGVLAVALAVVVRALRVAPAPFDPAAAGVPSLPR